MRCLQWNIILYKQQILHFLCFNIKISKYLILSLITGGATDAGTKAI